MIQKSICIFLRQLAVLLLIIAPGSVMAFDASRYASRSILDSGSWVKVSVSSTGLHFLSAADLRRMGFNDPEAVRVFGYGARRIPDLLSSSNFVDDVPQVPVHSSSKGVWFWAEGPDALSVSSKGAISVANNPFTSVGYYFLTDGSAFEQLHPVQSGTAGASSSPVTSFTDYVHHEADLTSPGESGHQLVGEDFRQSPARRFSLPLVDVASSDASLSGRFFSSLSSPSSLSVSVDGNKASSVNLSQASSDVSIYGVNNTFSIPLTLDPSKNAILVSLTLEASPSSVRKAALDYLTLNYQRHIRLNSGLVDFNVTTPCVSVANASSSTVVWDVTDPLRVLSMRLSEPDAESRVSFTANAAAGVRHRYVAWDPDASDRLPAPAFVGRVESAPLHSLPVPHMVIFTPAEWRAEAERLAEHRRNSPDSLIVHVISLPDVWNEFGSGCPDVGAMRRLLKMFYDRGKADPSGPQLRYALVMARSSHDNRRLTPPVAAMTHPLAPSWQSELGSSESNSFTTDDILGMLEDSSGNDLSSDKLSIAVGRLTVTSTEQARIIVDKIIAYETSAERGPWQQRSVMIADDEDYARHMIQAEDFLNSMERSGAMSSVLVDKVYIDAFPLVNGIVPEGRSRLHQFLDDGTLWLSYIGHANASSLSGEGILTYTDINRLYLKHIPFIYAATCNFMRWDAAAPSGAELLLFTEKGGVIGAISASRTALITDNGYLSNSMANVAFSRDSEGRPLPVGEIFRRAKNEMKINGMDAPNSNKLRYGLLADPAMRLALPRYTITLDAVNGKPVNADEPPVLGARSHVTLSGTVRDADGRPVTDFSGRLTATLYDAEESVTTLAHGQHGTAYTFEQHGRRLMLVTDTVIDGHFSARAVMPAEVADNFRPATLALTAFGRSEQAAGISRSLYVYGTDDEAPVDSIAPEITSLYLNHPSFADGETVNSSPLLIADIADDVAINMSTAGVGHSMTITLDTRPDGSGSTVLSDVTSFYQPSSASSGRITYPLSDLSDGPHTLTLRIWDSAGNSAYRTISFNVSAGARPVVYDLYSDANPATDRANFYLVHDRPDADLRVTVAVYDLLGRPVWGQTVEGRADMFSSFPVTWDLNDSSGRRVARGIYLYRAYISEIGGAESNTVTRKIAVTSGR